MEIKISTESLDSKDYRILFELASLEGIEALQKLSKDLEILEASPLGELAILEGIHPTLSLTRNNKTVIAYLREHKNEIKGLRLTNPYTKNILEKLASNPKILNTYLENARLLEEYRIGSINFISDLRDYTMFNRVTTSIWKDKEGNITNIIKYYTDGEFKYGTLIPPRGIFDCEKARVELSREVPATWILRTENHEDGRQFRYMYISSFDFNADKYKFPTEEELQSYDLPASLKLHLNK